MAEEGLVSEDALLNGRIRLLQLSGGHRAGTDAVLLAACADVRAGETVIDAGAGTGAVGLMIGARAPDAAIVLVERDPTLADLARRTVALNGFEARARVAQADLLDKASRRAAGLVPESADVVLTNPPFLDERTARASPDARRAAAHMLPEGELEGWIRSCAALLRPQGRLCLIHRADSLADCLRAIKRAFGGARLRFVHPQAHRPATRLLLTAVKGSRAPLKVEVPLVLHDGTGRFTPLCEALHRGDATLT